MAKKHFYEFEAIMKRLEEETNDTGRNVIHINTIQRLLRDTPTIEAVPVVHAEWILCNEEENIFECSACGKMWVLYGTPKDNGMNFCTKCGARMDDDYSIKHLEAVRDRMRKTGLTNEEMEGHFFGKKVE